MSTKLVTEMSGRLDEKTNIESMINNPLEFPPAATQHGPPTEEWISMRENWIKKVNDDQKQVLAESCAQFQGRVNGNIPLLPWLPASRRSRLPAPKLRLLTHELQGRLPEPVPPLGGAVATGETREGKDLDFATPPDDTALKAEYDARAAAQPVPTGITPNAPDNKAEINFKRRRSHEQGRTVAHVSGSQCVSTPHLALGPRPPPKHRFLRPWSTAGSRPTSLRPSRVKRQRRSPG